MKKFLILIFLACPLSFLFAEEQSKAAQNIDTLAPSSEKSLVKIEEKSPHQSGLALGVGFERIDYTYQKWNSIDTGTKIDDEANYGLTLSLDYEWVFSSKMSTNTQLAFSYVPDTSAVDSENASGQKKRTKSGFVSQTLNYSFESQYGLWQPYIGVGIGYQFYTFKEDESDFWGRNSQTDRGLAYEMQLGLRWFTKDNWIPFLSASYRRFNVDATKVETDNFGEFSKDVDGIHFLLWSVKFGVSYRF